MQIVQHDARFASADQITPADLAEIAAAGYRSIICNRPDGEGGAAQPSAQAIRAAAQKLGLQFAYLPVKPGQITAADAARFGQLLDDLPGPVLAYCRSGNRATSLYQLAGRPAAAGAAQTHASQAVVPACDWEGAPYDIVVIGGGIIGVFAAYYLARRGVSVALVEKGRIGAEQSSRNWGWCRQQNRDERELPMASKSIDLWERFAAESGEDTGFHRCGLLYLSNDDAELSRWASWGEFAKTAGVTTYMLDGKQATERGHATGRQ
jgi:uncharacterized protein (TIGR01244 family)